MTTCTTSPTWTGKYPPSDSTASYLGQIKVKHRWNYRKSHPDVSNLNIKRQHMNEQIIPSMILWYFLWTLCFPKWCGQQGIVPNLVLVQSGSYRIIRWLQTHWTLTKLGANFGAQVVHREACMILFDIYATTKCGAKPLQNRTAGWWIFPSMFKGW